MVVLAEYITVVGVWEKESGNTNPEPPRSPTSGGKGGVRPISTEMNAKTKNKAYVVFAGRTPGIYDNWNECRENTEGFPNADFRGYQTYDEAVVAWEEWEQRTGYGTEQGEPVSPSDKERLVIEGKVCPYCWGWSVCADSAEIYNGRSYGWIWLCRPCRAYVGCHKGTKEALGRLADAHLREKKKAFHAELDPLWKSGRFGRSWLYEWLAKEMGMSKDRCHGGMFNTEQCDNAIEILRILKK